MAQDTKIEVLLVEDNPGDARLVEIMLSKARPGDFEVTHVARLREAIERLDDSMFDVILLDLSLPDSDSMETVYQTRMAAPRTPIVVLTGQDDEEVALKALQGGAEDYLVKGGDRELIARSIRYAIERKRAEEALRSSEERFRSLVQNALDIITVLEADGTVRYESPAIERILGYAPQELIGTNAFDYVHLEDVERVRSVFAETLLSHEVSPFVEFRFRHADGSWRYLEAIGYNRLEDPSVKGMVVNSRDVTERKQAERERARLLSREQAAHSEAEMARKRLKAILDNLSEGVLVADLKGRVVFANPAARAMLGIRNEESSEELPDLWEDFDLPKAVNRCIREKEGIEARVRSGESYLWVKLECLAISERTDALIVMQDLSEGHRLEANQQRFLANAAHQLRTPTMSIMGAAELLATGEDADPAMRSRLLNYIFSEGRRMQRLSDALLRLARVGWDLRDPDLEVVDSWAAGQRAVELIEPLAESAGLRLGIEGEGACISADPEWLQEILLVLLSNAIKYSGRDKDIRVRISDNTITVEDEGEGISSSDLPHVFERFYRGNGGSEGFGLGLPICRELIERMGGDISIRSQEGVGTIVKVELPEAILDA
jgi:PAS domain S-box-containing protein